VKRPYVLLSCAMSINGYTDDASERRLILSDQADLDRVDELRAGCDAIIVGAGTIRADNPRLVLRSHMRRKARVARGQPPDPVKVTLTSSGGLDPTAHFFAAGEANKIVYVASSSQRLASERLGAVADVVPAGDPVNLGLLLADLVARGVGRLLVEGGSSVRAQFLRGGLADELQLAVAPFFIGTPCAPRLADEGGFPWDPQHPARLTEIATVGGMALLRYALSDRYADVLDGCR
jgi:5-amino-6-(5-phosphoribosylamino)uracil reductase